MSIEALVLISGVLTSSNFVNAGINASSLVPTSRERVADVARETGDTPQTLEAQCVRAYAAMVHDEYRASLASAEEMRAAIQAFCAAPTMEGLTRARETWTAAREIYGRTEAFRFGNGPIDTTRGGTETFINAWPVDESYIEPEADSATTGIVRDRTKYPALGRVILKLHNQRGGETGALLHPFRIRRDASVTPRAHAHHIEHLSRASATRVTAHQTHGAEKLYALPTRQILRKTMVFW